MKRTFSFSGVAATVASGSLVAMVKPLEAAVVSREVGTWVYVGNVNGPGPTAGLVGLAAGFGLLARCRR